VSPEQLADRVRSFIMDSSYTFSSSTIAGAVERILSDGARQYYDPVTNRQKFEDMDPAELMAWAREESQDAVVYIVMLDTITHGTIRSELQVIMRKALELDMSLERVQKGL
jgi:hypothetical protein